ncbi:MAG: methylmalonyl-CoA/ethylmalonyl-CoA epimerase [Yoonia sp.]
MIQFQGPTNHYKVNDWLSRAVASVPIAPHKTPKLVDWRIPMIGRLNHVAIAVPDLDAAINQYRNTLGADVGAPQDEPDHGVTVVFITLPNTKIELLYPLGDASPIQGFLDKNPSGGIHHICYEVDDILAARDHLIAEGARVLGTGDPKIGAHGKPVLFLHPKDFNGCLVELEQV